MNDIDEPFLTTCDLCNNRTAAMPGPRFRRGRPEAPVGFEVGFIVEVAERSYPICRPCLDAVLLTAALEKRVEELEAAPRPSGFAWPHWCYSGCPIHWPVFTGTSTTITYGDVTVGNVTSIPAEQITFTADA